MIQHQYIFKKVLVLITFIFFSNTTKAEHFLDFYLQDLDLSNYPVIKIKGGVLEQEEDLITLEGIAFFENNKKIEIDATFKKLQNNFEIFTITYTTQLSKDATRKLKLRYDLFGFHNGYEGQLFEYNPKDHRYIKEISNYGYEDENLSIYINNILIDYERDGLEDMYVLAKNGLLVRERPTTAAEVIGKLDFRKMSKVSIQQYGEQITVTENKNLPLEIEGRFRKINYEGKEGYIFDGYLTKFSLFTSINKDNLCDNFYEIPELEKSNESYRVSLEDDKYGEYIEFKYIYLQEIYLIAQAAFGDFKNLEIKEQQDYGEIYNGFKHYKFKNTDEFMFKLLRLDGYFNELSYHKIYLLCY